MTLIGHIVGTKGNTGRGIASIVENADYTITINLTDGTSYTTAPIAGFTDVAFDENYDLVVTKTDGTEVTVETDLGDYEDLLAGYKSDAESAKADAESAQTYAETAKSGADASALKAEQWAKGTKNGTPVTSGDDGYNDNSKYYKEQASSSASSAGTSATNASNSALKSEGYAIGKQNGTDVTSGSTYYENNAKYYSQEASTSATNAGTSETNASGSASTASTQALKSEGYAVGKQNGTDVSSGSDYYQNNSKYYSGQASSSATSASTSANGASASALVSEGYALGQQNGTDVSSGSPYYENNAKYYADEAQGYAESIDPDTLAKLEDISELLPTETASGDIASFNDGQAVIPALSCVATITPIQSGSGTPSPSNVRPISGYDEVEVGVVGVNLLGLQNRTAETLTAQQYTQAPNIGEDKYYIGFSDTLLARPSYVTNVNISSGSVSFTTATTIGYGVSFPFRCKPNTTYFKHADTASNVNLIPVYCDSSGKYIGKENNGAKNIAFTTPNNCYYVLLSVIGNAIGSCSATGLSINYPSTVTDYTPYNGQTYTDTLPTTVYGGTLDLVSGVLTVDRALVTFDGSQSDFGVTVLSDENFTQLSWLTYISTGKPNGTFISDKLVQTTTADRGVNTMWNGGTSRMFIGVPVTVTTEAEAKTYFTSEPTTVIYELATPITYQLTPQHINTLLGDNNIFADSGDVSVTYKADIQKYIDNKIEEVNVAILALS